MRIVSRILSVLAIAGLAFFNTGCGSKGGDTDPAEKIQLAKLSSTWKISSVTLDGTDRTSDFTNFTLAVGGSFNTTTPKGPYTYTTSGTKPNPNPWPASGTWSFGSNVQTDLIRLDNPDLSMTYTVTDTQFTLSFTYSGAGYAGSRVNQVTGVWVFVFTK